MINYVNLQHNYVNNVNIQLSVNMQHIDIIMLHVNMIRSHVGIVYVNIIIMYVGQMFVIFHHMNVCTLPLSLYSRASDPLKLQVFLSSDEDSKSRKSRKKSVRAL